LCALREQTESRQIGGIALQHKRELCDRLLIAPVVPEPARVLRPHLGRIGSQNEHESPCMRRTGKTKISRKERLSISQRNRLRAMFQTRLIGLERLTRAPARLAHLTEAEVAVLVGRVHLD